MNTISKKILENKEVNILRMEISDFLRDKITDSDRMQVNDMIRDIVKKILLNELN